MYKVGLRMVVSYSFKAYNTANVLFEVLKAVNMTQSMEVDREVIFCGS